MKHKIFFINIILLFIFVIDAYSRSLVINEVATSNRSFWMDDLKEFPSSWVEIYNPTDSTICLKGYALGKNEDYSLAYKISDSLTIHSNDYLVFSCDKKNKGVHTSFKISPKDTSTIYLFDTKGEIIDKMMIPPLPYKDVTYGRVSKSNKTNFLLHATPKAYNDTKVVKKRLSSPKISVEGGLYNQSFYIKIIPSSIEKFAVVHYTLDGSEPTEQSAIFNDSIFIASNTILRLRAFANGSLPSTIKTHSYIFHDKDVTLPVVSIVTDSLWLYDTEQGIMGSLPNMKKKWKRPANFEYFPYKDSSAVINQIVQLKVGGMTSYKLNPIKPLILSADKRIGKSTLDYPFWKKEKPNVQSCESIFLRSSGQDCMYSYVRDVLSQLTFSRYVNVGYQAYQPVILYLNGVYKGLINLRERANEDFMSSNYGIKKVDVVKNWTILLHGDLVEFNKLEKLYTDSTTTLATLDSIVDIENFLNMMILSYIHQNTDYATNNVEWKERNNPKAKWHFIAKDLDASWGWNRFRNSKQSYKDPFLNDLLKVEPYDEYWDGAGYTTALFRKLMTFPSVRDEFIDRTTIYLGDFMDINNICLTFDSIQSIIDSELLSNQTLYHDYYGSNFNWAQEKENMINWMYNRMDYIPEDLKLFFHLSDTYRLKITTDVPIVINNIPLYYSGFNGKYYKDRTLTIKTKDKHQGRWVIQKVNNGVVQKEIVTTESLQFTNRDDSQSVTIIYERKQ